MNAEVSQRSIELGARLLSYEQGKFGEVHAFQVAVRS